TSGIPPPDRISLSRSPELTKKWDEPSGSGTLPDEKIRTERDLCLENYRYLAAPQQVIAEDAQLATSLGQGRGHADLPRGREFLHVSDAAQDFTSVMDTQGLGEGHAFTAIQNNANANANADVQARDPRALTETDVHDIMVSKVPRGENERTAADEAHDVIDMGKLQRRERIEKALDKRTEQEQDTRDEDANVRGVNDQVNETNQGQAGRDQEGAAGQGRAPGGPGQSEPVRDQRDTQAAGQGLADESERHRQPDGGPGGHGPAFRPDRPTHRRAAATPRQLAKAAHGGSEPHPAEHGRLLSRRVGVASLHPLYSPPFLPRHSP